MGKGQGQSHGGDGHKGLTTTPAGHTRKVKVSMRAIHWPSAREVPEGRNSQSGEEVWLSSPSSRGGFPVLLSKLRLSATPSQGACSGATDLLQENPGPFSYSSPQQDGAHSAQFLIPAGTSGKIHPELSTSEGSSFLCAPKTRATFRNLGKSSSQYRTF